jgi:hypothetical protein
LSINDVSKTRNSGEAGAAGAAFWLKEGAAARSAMKARPEEESASTNRDMAKL